MTSPGFTLVGDGIEDPHNALAMSQIAGALGAACAFLDRKRLQEATRLSYRDAGPLPCLDLATLAAGYRPIIACDTLSDAVDLFGCRVAGGARPALVVGNERLGLTHTVQAMAQQRVRIPMTARGIDSLNVAAAAAVALYFLAHGSGTMQTRRDLAAQRPNLLLLAPSNHAELGCAIRSAAAFGWGRLLVEDRAGVWFGADRQRAAEGRAAARWSKNSISVVPVGAERRYAYYEAVVVRAVPGSGSVPLHRANLARRGRQLIVIPDETGDLQADGWARLGRTVRFSHLELPDDVPALRYRALASIAMAEVARQVGRASPGTRPDPSRGPRYDRALELLVELAGEDVPYSDLLAY